MVASLLFFFALALDAALLKSPTTDEPVHLTRGVLLAQRNDLALQGEHTPLSHRLIGSLAVGDASVSPLVELASWGVGDRLDVADEFLWESGLDVDRVLFLGRLPIIWLALLLGATLALWTGAVARQQVMWTTGWRLPAAELPALALVMALFASSSNLLASAAVATTDLAATATYFAAVCAWWFYWQRPGKVRWLLTGILLGLGLSAKLTGALLIPLLLPLAYVYRRGDSWWRPAAVWLALIPVAGLVVWANYGFEVGLFHGFTVPAPTYLNSVEAVLTHVDEGHQAYFFGDLSTSGWLLYFPVVFLIKTPLVMIGLLAAALVVVARRRSTWGVAAFTLLPAAALFLVAIYSRLNIGYRHILPVLPFLLVLMGVAVPWLWRRTAWRWALAGAAVSVMAVALWQHPHHLAYFNIAIGGPAQAYRYVGDSNLDWGQDLKLLADLAAMTEEDFYFSYAGVGRPAYYGLEKASLEGGNGTGLASFSRANPAPGLYALSANRLQGLLPESDLFDWFRRREPDGSLGYSILLYRVDEAAEGSWIAHCLAPGPLLTPEQAEQRLGVSGVRHLYFDCAHSWVWPSDGAPGWYVLPRQSTPWWVMEWLPPGEVDQLPVVYDHHATEMAPDFAIARWQGDGPGDWAQKALPAVVRGERIVLPHEVGEAASLVSYWHTGTDYFTLWQATATPALPLSVQAHLARGPGRPPHVADALGFSSEQWQPGDWFLQRHTFAEGTRGAYFQTGLYDFQTLERLGDQIRLPFTPGELSRQPVR